MTVAREPLHLVTGTRRAADVCRKCRHSRIRHAGTRGGTCVAVKWEPVNIAEPDGPLMPELCGCESFAETEVLA